MHEQNRFTPEQLHYLRLLSRRFPTIQDTATEIIRLRAVLNLPKGTEHFMSDIHGEHEAFLHILNSCSGEVRVKLQQLFGGVLPQQRLQDLATLIYYPRPKLNQVADRLEDLDDWYDETLRQLVQLCHYVSDKYTRAKVRQAIPERYKGVIDELLHSHTDDEVRRDYFDNLVQTVILTGQAPELIEDLCALIKHLVVDHLHIVGDIFDRGPRADIVMDSLMRCHSVDIQWGNHDVLWMGAASGSRTLIATVLANSIRYNNLDVIETGYGISLRPLSVFANQVYNNCDLSCFQVKLEGQGDRHYTEQDKLLSARMHKAITIMLLKLEGQKILRHPEYGMADRLLLDKIDYEAKTVQLPDGVYPIRDCDFPTVDPADPYALTEEESQVIDQLKDAFYHSEKLQRHVRFLYSKGGLYKIHNGNLLFHGCIPMTESGQLMSFTLGGRERRGREFLDYAEQTARKAYYDKWGSRERRLGMDFLWWLWAGRNSPIFGRDRMTTFERRFIADESTWTEPKNPYYTHCQKAKMCEMLLREFGLEGAHCHIINGHVPVKVKKGESPIKGGGKLLVIDGGFSKAYQSTSGIAGYTLIFTSRNMRMVSHQPFAGRQAAILENRDIANEKQVFEEMDGRIRIADTDQGVGLQQQVDELLRLLEAYRCGAVAENHSN